VERWDPAAGTRLVSYSDAESHPAVTLANALAKPVKIIMNFKRR
jgi:hypothetical protein